LHRKPGTSEVFQRHPEGKGTKLDTGLRRYDVTRRYDVIRFFQMKSLILDLNRKNKG
jgi:hypothetical protein